jgi:predicted permease
MIEAGTRTMFATLPSEFAEFIRILPLAPDGRVFLFMMGAAILAAVLFGLAPAIQATRASVVQAARGDFTNEYRPSRLRNALVVAQIAGCAGLLIASIALLRGATRIGDIQTGLRTRDTIDLEIQEKSRTRVLAALASEPVVEIIAASAEVPLDGGFPAAQVASVGDSHSVLSSYDRVSPEFFPVFDIPIVRGRNFTAEEARSGAPVALVSKTVARRLWPEGEAVGQSVRLARDPETHRGEALIDRELRVIGVVGDIITGFTDDAIQRSCVYFPTTPDAHGAMLILRVKGDVEAARRKLDASLTAADPGAIDYIHKMDQFKAGRVYPFRVAWWVSGVVGVLALLLTVAGIYGVLSYLVVQRTKEIGIRMAMGASAGEVVRMVLRQSMRLAAIGLGIAVALAFALSRVISSRIILIVPFDLLAYAMAVALVFAACVGAAYFPSRKAARIDPLNTLRYD